MSTIGLECATCEARYKIPADKGITKFNCKRCGTSIFIPGARRTTSVMAIPAGADTNQRRRTSTSSMTVSGISTRRRNSSLATYVMAAFALVALVSGVYYFIS